MASRFLVVALLGMSTAHAGVNEFTLTGNEGGSIYSIAVQPGNANVVLAGSVRGIYRSTNGGLTWTLTTPDMIGIPTQIAFDADTPSRVYVVNRRVYVSEDGGQSFVATTGEEVSHLAANGARVYRLMYDGTIYRSDDGAHHWTQLTVPWASPNAYVGVISVDPSNDDVLYACVQEQGTYKTTNGGMTWSMPAAPNGSPCSSLFNYSNSIVVSPADPNRIVASTSDGMFLSTNGGVSWSVTETLNYPQWVVFDPHAPDNLLGVAYAGRVQYSTDGGATWPLSSTGANLRVREVKAAAYGNAAGQLYIATPNGPMYSTDNGATFSLRVGGIHATQVREVIAADDGTIYAAQSSGQAGVFRRSAGSWIPLDNAELASQMLNPMEIADIATSPEDSSLLYVVNQSGGLHRSNNGGADWIAQPPSLHSGNDIAVDPTNPLVAYAARYDGMMRTIDGGRTFTECSSASLVPMRNVIVARTAPNILYAIGRYGPTTGIYRSSDSCATWTDIATQLPYYFNSVAVDPLDHQKIHVADYGGVNRTRNGGVTWEQIRFNFNVDYPDYVSGHRVLFDPVLPSTIWVLNADVPGFARSVDDGATWQKAAYPYTGNYAFLESGVLDPLRPDTLVAGASGHGLVEYQVAPDLHVTLDAPAAAIPASAVATVNLRNNGPLDASAADITVTLPAFLSVSAPPAGCTINASTVRCRVAPVRINQTTSILLTLIASNGGSANVSVSVAGHEADPVSSNNSATAAVQATARADLAVTGPAAPTIGRTTSTNLDFTLTNQGPDIAANARVTFTLPAGLQATAATSPAGACTVTATLVTCALGTLNANAGTTAQLRVEAMNTGTHEVSTQLVSDAIDTDQDQNIRTSVVVQPLANLSVELAATSGTLTTGTPFQYTATIRNAGPDAAAPRADVTVTGATITTSTTTSTSGLCVVSGSNVQCQLGDLASGGSTTVTLTVNAATAGSPSADASVTFTGTDPTTPDNRTTLTTTVTAPAPPPGSSGGGGGGGRFDWLAALLLGALALRRMERIGYRGRA